MGRIIGLQVNPSDNVATVFSNDAEAGAAIVVLDKIGGCRDLVAKQSIPYGHKIALMEIRRGEEIVKYGQVIGKATADIAEGEYVHIHNLESCRGRGDWEKGETE